MGSLQKKYNDFMDAGGHAVSFYAKNQLLNDDTKSKKTRQKLEDNYQKLQEKRQKYPKERIKIIRKRLKNYLPATSYDYGIINTFQDNAPADIEFLLNENDWLHTRIKNLWFALRTANEQLRKNRR